MKLYSFLLIIFVAFFSTSFNSSVESEHSKVPSDSIKTVTLTFVGDLMCHIPQVNYARIGQDSFNFKPVYTLVKPFLSNSDFTFGNLETVTAGRRAEYTGYPLFNSPDEFTEALAASGFDFMFTSNNHSLDRSEKGIIRTIEILNKYGIKHTGTFSSQLSRDSIIIISISGIRTAFLSYSYGTNGNPIPQNKNYLINLIDTVLIKSDIKKAKLYTPDLIVVYFHFGEEYEREPSAFQKEIAAKTAQYGADLIIGSHPHVIQPFTFLQGKHRIDSVMTVFSLGNFISNQRDRYRDAGIILNVKITKNFTKDTVYYSGYSFIPTWVFKGSTGSKREYIIFPEDSSATLPPFLSNDDIMRMKQSFNDTRSIFQKK